MIDFVITWVDGSDPDWIRERSRYVSDMTGDNSEVRYRDMGLLKYWFRAVEKHASWVNKIFFVTCGQIPKWLNTNNAKLEIVNHNSFIPVEYLPTFSSHTIELNLHRIRNLSENFVYFNDDTFVINNITKKEFFRKDLPCDYAVLSPLIPREDIQNISLNVIKCINEKFLLHDVIKNNFFKWYSYEYGIDVIRNIIFSRWPAIVGFRTQHMPNAYKKSTFSDVWKMYYSEIDKTCNNKFRDVRDVNQWLMQYWQIVTGKFIPYKKKGVYIEIDNSEQLQNIFQNNKYKLLCVNDSNVEDFYKCKNDINKLFKYRYPEKSSFEI